MNISCIHCGGVFSITAEQLGKRGKCPHCRATVILPRSTNQTRYQQEQLEPPSRFSESLLCGFLTVVVHLLILIICALVPWGEFSDGTLGEGEEILIGQLSREQLVDTPSDELTPTESEFAADADVREWLDTNPLLPAADPTLDAREFEILLPSMLGGGTPSRNESTNRDTLLAAGREDFGQMITRLRQSGLDIVIVFDSTKSMKGEIAVVKDQIERIGSVLFQLVPATRLGICTYRDVGDEYEVKGLPLTDNLAKVSLYLETIEADGGGNIPEAVDAGMEWAITRNEFRNRARKVILLFGDAPPHPGKRVDCQKLASDFRKQGGLISTVTCRKNVRLPEFEAIAKIGGGESYLTANERQIMSQLIVLVFGTRHREKVLEAFDLLRS